MASKDLAKKQIADEYECVIKRLELVPDDDLPSCDLAKPARDGMLLMLRYRALKLKEELSGSLARHAFVEAFRLAVMVSVLATIMNPEVWKMVGTFFLKLTPAGQ